MRFSGASEIVTVHSEDDEDDDDDGAAPSRRRCVGCGDLSPPTRSAHTLISSEHGWRLARQITARGEYVYEWRCPKCWRKHKDRSVKDV
jgi:hypothetical protein